MSYDTKNIRNIALMGHGNSGKTSLAESMLFTTGAIDRLGKVTDGNTVCDYDPEEIKRQITISAALAPIEFGGCKINVLDCPGYQDFAGEVLGAIRAIEAGLIVCSAKDGLSVGAERCWNRSTPRPPWPRLVHPPRAEPVDAPPAVAAIRSERLPDPA
jgi:elongation factor G